MKPDFETFKRLAKEGNLVPIVHEIIADTETPVSAFRKIAYSEDGKPYPYSFLLESVEGGEKIARYSFLGTNPNAVFISKNGKAELIEKNGSSTERKGSDVFEKIEKVVSAYKPATFAGLPPFFGGAVGYFSYDTISESEKTVPQPSKSPLDVPDAVFMLTDTLLAFDKVRHSIKIIALAKTDYEQRLETSYDEAISKINEIERKLRLETHLPTASLDEPLPEHHFSSNKTREEFCDMVRKAKRYIVDGDIIQTVLSQRFSTPVAASPLSVHRALRILNPSPYMFLLNCGNFSLVGASPEVHAKCIDGKITVRPIAGTRKRGKTDEEDKALAEELLADPKERAEHIMLVDLARNDIGRVAEPGTVKVDELMIIEKYSHVMHIVSNVSGIRKANLGADAVMRATFPAGTLSGAPKIRAMQIISELENERRGPYGGAVAYYSFNGNLDSCITIRTSVLKDGIAYIQSGAGIVADSVPETEFEETVNKAKAMMKAIALSERFEKG